MHETGWKLVNDFICESAPTWDVTLQKNREGPPSRVALSRINFGLKL